MRRDGKIRELRAILFLLFATAIVLFFLWHTLEYLYQDEYPAPWVE